MNLQRRFTTFCGSLALAMLATASAHATVVGVDNDIDFSTAPYTVSFGGGAATYTFSDSGIPSGFIGTLPAIQTGGTALVASVGPPFKSEFEPTTYFTDESRREFISSSLLAQFKAYPNPAPIDNGIVDSYLGLSFELDDGIHYGFARLAGLTLTEYAYETEPGVGIQTGPGPFAAIPAQVPEPAALGLFGLGLIGLMRLRSKRV